MSPAAGDGTGSASALIGLLRLASPALPVGGFSYSEGLEAAVDSGLVDGEDSARLWLLDQLQLSLARSELAVVAAAWQAWTGAGAGAGERLAALNDWVLQTRESGEFRQQTLQMGRSLAAWLRAQSAADARVTQLLALRPAPSWPLAFSLAALRTGAPLHDSLIAFGFSWAENMVQAAVKSVPLGQSAGQRLLGALAEALPLAAQQAAALGDADRQCFSPGLAILSARHEEQYSRLFRS